MKATPTVAEFDPVCRDGGPDNSIRTRGLTKAFGSQVAVKDIDLDLPTAA